MFCWKNQVKIRFSYIELTLNYPSPWVIEKPGQLSRYNPNGLGNTVTEWLHADESGNFILRTADNNVYLQVSPGWLIIKSIENKETRTLLDVQKDETIIGSDSVLLPNIHQTSNSKNILALNESTGRLEITTIIGDIYTILDAINGEAI